MRTLQKNGKFHLRLKASNDEIILQSQGYVDKVGAQNEITSVTKNDRNNGLFKKEASSGKFYFVLEAVHGQIVGQSK
ncbi:MAG: YegP family protein [Akkermansiaceae bacterium]